MTIQTLNQDMNLLEEIEGIADDYGVKSVDIYPSSQLAEIIYKELGQGSALSNLISEMMADKAPKRAYRIRMIPADRKLVVELR